MNINEIMRKYNIRADKSMSQNFLTDSHVISKIVKAADLDENTTALEIGSGLGSLTEELLKEAGKVVAIELDKRLFGILETEYGCQKLELINADIMKTDLDHIIRREIQLGRAVKVCANLPYHITTPVIMNLLEKTTGIQSMTLMMQKEVAERITAKPGSSCYGAITPAISYYASVTHVANVPPNCFVPRPEVHSAVLNFEIRQEKPVRPKNEELMFRVIRAAFGQRRKTIYNALSNQILPDIGLSREQLLECFDSGELSALGVTPSVRGETLGLMEFAKLSDEIFVKYCSITEK